MSYGFGRINDLAHEINTTARSKGFYDSLASMGGDTKNPVWLQCRLMLVVSELGEACEGVRKNNFSSVPASGGLGEELADAIIRILDIAESTEINIEQAIVDKMQYNSTRDRMHGNKNT